MMYLHIRDIPISYYDRSNHTRPHYFPNTFSLPKTTYTIHLPHAYENSHLLRSLGKLTRHVGGKVILPTVLDHSLTSVTTCESIIWKRFIPLSLLASILLLSVFYVRFFTSFLYMFHYLSFLSKNFLSHIKIVQVFTCFTPVLCVCLCTMF